MVTDVVLAWSQGLSCHGKTLDRWLLMCIYMCVHVLQDEKLDRWAGMMGQWRKRVDEVDSHDGHTH